jgi:hypothetical protein
MIDEARLIWETLEFRSPLWDNHRSTGLGGCRHERGSARWPDRHAGVPPHPQVMASGDTHHERHTTRRGTAKYLNVLGREPDPPQGTPRLWASQANFRKDPFHKGALAFDVGRPVAGMLGRQAELERGIGFGFSGVGSQGIAKSQSGPVVPR